MTAIDRPIVSRILFGRELDLAALDDALAQTSLGHGQTVLIAGEAGIGKTRLLGEASAHARSAGLAVLEGHCFEEERALPLAPFIDLLRNWLRESTDEEVAERLGETGGALLALVPELARRSPALEPLPALDPEQLKRRIFQAVSELIARAAAKAPLLVMIEDVHWSDASSAELLMTIARATAGGRTMLLVSYRPDEAGPSLRRFLAELDRRRLGMELRPAPLGFDDSGSMLRNLLEIHTPVPGAFLAVIHSLTEGNPFFIEEVLRSLIASGDVAKVGDTFQWRSPGDIRIPRTVDEAVRRRSDQVSPPAREVLAIAAVAGRRFEFALLQAVARRADREILQNVRELIDAQLVVEESADRFAFRHALTRQAVYSALLGRERRDLHREVAETLEQMHAAELDDHVSDLSYHFHEAGLWQKAIVYGRRAGEKARALYAPQSVVEEVSRALHAAVELGQPADPELLGLRGRAYETLGDFPRARQDLEAAYGSAQDGESRSQEWSALLDLGQLWASSDYAKAGELYERALALARLIAEPAPLAHSLNRMGNWLINVGRTAEGLRAHEEALAIFRADGDQSGVAETLDLLGMGRGIHGDVAEGVRQYRGAIQLLRGLGQSEALISALASHAVWASPFLAEATSSGLGTLETCTRDAAEALGLAKRSGSLAGEAYAEWTAAAACAGFGTFGDALAHAERSLSIATEIEHQQWITAAHFTLGHIYLLLLDVPAAILHLEHGQRLANELGSAWWRGNIGASLVLARIRAGKLDTARAVLAEALPRGYEVRTLPERRLALAQAELALASDDPDSALSEVDRLLASALTDGDHPIPALQRTRAAALDALGRREEALDALADAERGATERHEPSLLWRVRLVRGHTLASSGIADQARDEYAAARSIIQELAATLPDGALRETFVREANAMMPRTAGGRSTTVGSHGLTAREREVALLVTAGMSNRAIAGKLFVGERTVEAHVSSILGKLGQTSRAQIAAWATSTGLAKESG